MASDEIFQPIVRDRLYMSQWVAFYMTLGYTEPQSEILAEQLCSDGRRAGRATVDQTYGFTITGKYFRQRRRRVRKAISADDIRRGIPDFV